MKTKPYIPASYRAETKQIQSDNLRFVVVTVRYIVAFFYLVQFRKSRDRRVYIVCSSRTLEG